MKAVGVRDLVHPGLSTRWQPVEQVVANPNTLDYRLRAIEDALGFAVRLGTGTFKLQLALKLLPLARNTPPGRL